MKIFVTLNIEEFTMSIVGVSNVLTNDIIHYTKKIFSIKDRRVVRQ